MQFDSPFLPDFHKSRGSSFICIKLFYDRFLDKLFELFYLEASCKADLVDSECVPPLLSTCTTGMDWIWYLNKLSPFTWNAKVNICCPFFISGMALDKAVGFQRCEIYFYMQAVKGCSQDNRVNVTWHCLVNKALLGNVLRGIEKDQEQTEKKPKS